MRNFTSLPVAALVVVLLVRLVPRSAASPVGPFAEDHVVALVDADELLLVPEMPVVEGRALGVSRGLGKRLKKGLKKVGKKIKHGLKKINFDISFGMSNQPH